MKPKEIFPTSTELKERPEFYKNKILTYKDEKIVFDQDIRTGICYFCKKEGRKQRSEKTILHHLKYDDLNPLEWTMEICVSYHYRVDKRAKKIIDKNYDKKKETVEIIAMCNYLRLNNIHPS